MQYLYTRLNIWLGLRPCIPNFKANIWVGFLVGMSFRDFQNLIVTSFFCNFRKVRNRTNSKFSINSECLETPVSELFWTFSVNFDPKTGFFWPKNRKLFPNLFPNYFCKIFASLKSSGFSEKIPNFESRTFPKLTKTKSSEIDV